VTIATADTLAPGVDTVQPWPGLDAFTENLSQFFCGRDTETDELFRHVQRDVATVLLGQSGLGKTSLLQAGLFPRLRKAGFLPILIRLDYSTGAPPPVAQVKAAMEREGTATRLSATTWSTAEESLWGCFHCADRRLTDSVGEEVVPVLVFDQFEEIFTQGLAGSGSRAASQRFITDLAELLENRPPGTLEQAIEADPEIVERFRFDRQDYRVMLALREDFLAALEGLRTRAPSLGRNRYRLRPMTGTQGLDAILNPVPGLVDYEAAQEIIRFVDRVSPEYSLGATSAGDAAEGFEVEPSLLSLVCRELNERRIAIGLDEIGTDLLAGSRDEIIDGFYERCLAGRPPQLRAFVEDRMLTPHGFRESVTLDTARHVLSDNEVPAAALDELVRLRLLRIEEGSDVARVEIIHDVLTPVIRRSRDTRRLREAEAEAADRQAALNRERGRVRRANWFATAMTLLAVVTIGLFWWGWTTKIEAERQRAEIEKQRATAAAESKRAEQNFQIALSTTDSLVVEVAERLRPVGGVPVRTVRDILSTAEGLFDGLAAVTQNSSDLRWHRTKMLLSFAYTYEALGESVDVLRRAEAARDTMEVLVKEDPSNMKWAAALAGSYRAVGDILCNGEANCFGDLSGASAQYNSDLRIIKALSEKDPDNPDWQDELARAYSGIGNVFFNQGALAEALAEYQAALDIAPHLAEKDPGSPKWQQNLLIDHENVGNVLRAQYDLPGAAAEYRVELDIARRLANTDPVNTQRQRSLATSHSKVGEVFRDKGDLPTALAEQRAALDISKRLAEQDRGNAQWGKRHCGLSPARRRRAQWPTRSTCRSRRIPYRL
jgi:tetratricopeptide (TPR) repeat protein